MNSHPRHLDWRFVLRAVKPWILPLWFATYALLTLLEYLRSGFVGIDVLLYREAAIAAISGGDPWASQASGLAFAGPPSTLLFYLPTALLPLPFATVALLTLGVVAGVWAVRRLALPIWWLLFPPVFEAILVGNPDVFVLALLLVRGPLAGLAGALKVYALIPLVLQRRWAAVAVTMAVTSLSYPWFPQFLASLDSVIRRLDVQSAGMSAWGTWLLVPTILALVALRRRGAEWLVVPGIWPNTQGHYGAIALPAVHRYPLAAAVIGISQPLAPPLGIILMWVEVTLRERRAGGAESTLRASAPPVISTTRGGDTAGGPRSRP